MSRTINLLIILSVLCAIMSCSESEESQKIVYINNAKVFQEYNLKKEYDKKLEEVIQQEKLRLNGVKEALQSEKNEDRYKQLIQRYQASEQIINEKIARIKENYTVEVNNSLNNVLKIYGKEKGYDFILGSKGDGNVMYAKEESDITDDVINYINSQ